MLFNIEGIFILIIMCGIVGIHCKDTELGIIIFKELMSQSQIRGKHASGMSYLSGKKIKTISEPIPANEFIEKDLPQSEYIIGHVRYSTSDINYNQPIQNEEFSIVHNGVITQEPFEKWSKYGDDFKTKNDTEILLKNINKNPFVQFPDASIACGILSKNMMSCMRNNTRPLWIFHTIIENISIGGFASTESIISRAFDNLGIDVKIKKAEPFKSYEFRKETIISIDEKYELDLFDEDQQKSTKIEEKYV